MTERVLIADDHPLTREALAGLLSANGFDVVGQATDGADAVEQAGALRPDLVVLDLTMPGMDGLTALPRIREAAPDTAVVVLTAAEDDANLLTAIRLGAAGYLLKNEPPERIVEFLRGVAHGEAALSGAVARRLMEQVREGDGSHGRRSGVVRRAPVGARARGAAAARPAPHDRGDRRAALHLGAHRPLAREEPAREARRLVAPRGARELARARG